jgi:very-short-patch-repair endonuclease
MLAVPQVRVPLTDLDRLDLLVGDRLVVECDSEAHHGSPEQRVRDLRRDAALAALGFIVLRFDYRQVLFEPDAVRAAVRGYVSRGLHLDSERAW